MRSRKLVLKALVVGGLGIAALLTKPEQSAAAASAVCVLCDVNETMCIYGGSQHCQMSCPNFNGVWVCGAPTGVCEDPAETHLTCNADDM
jgi:hypothetical protein